MELVQKTCRACEGDMPPLSRTEAEVLMRELAGWELAGDTKSIGKRLAFPDFAQALAFVDAVGALAESEGHHPDIELGWGRVMLTLTTHAIGGLSENDLIMAAKIDALG